MKIVFDPNEFTIGQYIEYLKRAYGAKLNGSPFGNADIMNWCRLKKVPIAYGGQNISYQFHEDIDNMRILTIEQLDRNEVEEMFGVLSQATESLHKSKVQRTRKQRTPFYYEVLEKNKKQYTKKTLKESILPENFTELGIKRNQLTPTRKRDLHTKKNKK